MNLERAAMHGRLSEAQAKKKRLEILIDSQAGTVRTMLNTALTPVADLEIPQVAELVDNIVGMWGELQAVCLEISRLERELR